MKNLAYSFTLLAMCVAQPLAAAHEQDAENGGTSRVVQRSRISASDAAQIVQRRTGARVLDAQPVRGGYRVKVLTRQGEVRVFFVDGESGTMQ